MLGKGKRRIWPDDTRCPKTGGKCRSVSGRWDPVGTPGGPVEKASAAGRSNGCQVPTIRLLPPSEGALPATHTGLFHHKHAQAARAHRLRPHSLEPKSTEFSGDPGSPRPANSCGRLSAALRPPQRPISVRPAEAADRDRRRNSPANSVHL